MTKKLIAIGNSSMQDDGVALEVGERIRRVLLEKEVEVIMAETDIDSCTERIQPGDEVYIMDSTYYGIAPGSITFSELNGKKDRKYIAYSMHGFNLIDILMTYGKKIRVFLIGIEIESIEMERGLSKTLLKKIDGICNHIIKLIL
ncbi:hydrogenase maturation protease [Clostridium thermarum]|uniref:hydrogenase maturation protease n=1 Tax=Clostridium thermarum TaxID=1716543 RepID=UPI00111E2C80|nr:hydrogenase maturation protease [Clostridium thermarum]